MSEEHQAFVYAIYPNEKQAELLQKTFGCCRFVYNKILALQNERYQNGEKHLSKVGANTYCNHELKGTYPFLKEVDKFALTNSIYHLSDAFTRFFQKNGGYPNFKSKHFSKKAYTTNYTNGNIAVGENYIKLPKLGNVAAVVHRQIPSDMTVKSVTVSQGSDGKYLASVLCACECSAPEKLLPASENTVGFDYKSDGLYVDSEGCLCNMPHYYRLSQERLAKAQRDLSRKIEANISGYRIDGNKRYPIYKRPLCECKNIQKARIKVARIQAHIANQRKDFLHKESAAITKLYDFVCVEDIDMKVMANHGFGNGKATLDNGYGMFRNMLSYKLAKKGGSLVKVSKFFPSSQLCCECGSRYHFLKDLSIRKWECPHCHAQHDRDVNAAVNIKTEGLRMLLSAASA